LSRDMKDDIFRVFIGMLTAYCLLQACQRNRLYWWAAYALTAAIACYAQFFMGPLLVMLNLWFLAVIRSFPGRFRNWFAANTVAFILVIPVLLFALNRSHALFVEADRWWVPRPTPALVAFYLKTLAFGYSDLQPHYKIALVLYSAVAFAGFLLSWRKDVRWALLLLFWMPLTVGVIILISLNSQSVFLYRSMALYGIPFYIWAAVAIARIPSVAARTALLSCMLLLTGFSLAQLYESRFSLLEIPHRPGHTLPLPYRDAAEFIHERSLPDDLVAHTAHTTIFPLHYYGVNDLLHANVGVEPGPIDNFWRCHPPIPMPEEFRYCYMVALQPLARDRNRIWLVFSETERLYVPYNPMSVYRWLDTHYTEVLHRSFGKLEVFLFQREQNGEPITVRSRDRDDGVSAELEYTGGVNTRYLKVQPDAGLVISPPEARRGALTLAFDDAPTGPVEDQPGAGGAGVTFSVSNRSDRAAECNIEVVFSDYLLEFASLDEVIPASGAWIVGDMYNPQPPPPAYALSVAANHLTGNAPAILTGQLTLPSGVYDTRVRLLGLPGFPGSGRSVLKLEVGGADLFAPLRAQRDPKMAWTWFAAAPILAPAESMPVALRAELPPGATESRNDAAYAAFVAADATSARTGETLAVPLDNVTIPPHAARTWRYSGQGRRVDIWVYESGADGRAYRIFRKLDR
ncbi:MAG: glycosyltransferase family 39 protein, partial [FCB group bacterium]|nr:glycosyltransferase family 39 protein [FCB group bacterium]